MARNAYLSLKKDMARLELVYPYVENEVSEEARIGSRTHWGYLEKPSKANGPPGSERPRREAANRDRDIGAHDGGTHRDSRREPGARKPRRNQADADADEPRPRKGNVAAKGRGGAGADTNQNTTAPVPAKRRRVEKPAPLPMSAAMERTVSTASNAGAGRGANAAVKESPVPESGKKRARAQNPTVASRKRYARPLLCV